MNKHIYKKCLLVSLLCACTACASTAKPQQLDEASTLLKGEEAQDLKTLRPRLMRQARQYEIKAKAAFERGEMEKAKLYAYQAIQKYQTARNFALRAQAQQLTNSMSSATQGLDAKEAQIALREKEKARYGQLKQSFDSLRQEQQSQKQNETSTAAQARRTLLSARTLQAEVIGQNAISAEPGKYAQARLLIETALDAYETKAFKDALNNAQQAVGLLQAVLVAAKSQPKANTNQVLTSKTPADSNTATTTSNSASPDEALARVAKSNIDEALKAQSAAISAGMDKQAPAQYAQAKFLLQSAETRLASKDFQGAQEKASQALVLFAKGSQAKPVDDTQSKQVLTTIQGAEDSRAEAIQRQAKDAPEFAQADYALDLARKALKANQNARALEKASQASLLFKQAQPPKKEEVKTTAVSNTTNTTNEASTTTSKTKVEGMITTLQVARADALGKLQDSTCPGPFKSFEALLELAQKRLDAGDSWQAFEFAVRASERLKQCQLSSSTPVASAKDAKEAKEAQAKLEKQKNDAATELQKAQASYAALSTQMPGDIRLREPVSLIANAQQWFKQNAYDQAQSLAQQAQKRIGELEKTRQAEVKAALVAQKAKEADEAKKVKAPETANTSKAITATGDCTAANRRLEQAQAAQMRVTSMSLAGRQEQQFKQQVMLLTRAKSLIKEQRCDDAYLLASQSQSGFEFLIELASQPKTVPAQTSTQTTKTTPTVTPNAALSADAIKAKMQAEQDRKKQEALANESIAKAKLWRSKVSNLKNEGVFQTADQILRQAQDRAQKQQWTSAAVMAEQAARAFSQMESESIKAKKAEEAIWKPAYAKVIEALQRRDEVKPLINEAERATFNLGLKSLSRARQAWENRQFFVSGKFADAARVSFDKAALAAEKRRAQEKVDAKNQADEAKRQKQLEQEKEIQRKTQEAKRKAEEAKQKLAQQDAQRKAEEAKQKEQQRILAEDALRRASVSYQLCVQKACASRDAKAWLKSKSEYEDAQSAMKAQRYVRAQTLAASSKMVFDQTVTKPMPFSIDSSITRISRVGNTLVLSPKISFKAGGTIATSDSLKTINELAKVLLANKGMVKSIALVGYTDDRGKKQNNIKLSLQRAQTVKNLLVKRGVDASSITVDGKGPESPVADNRTSKGREANRRVEVTLTWAQ